MGTVRAIAAALALVLAGAFPGVAAGQDAESSIYAAAKDCSGLRAYLRTYPNGRFRADADARIAKDCATPAPKPTPVQTVAPSPPPDPCIRSRADWPHISASSDLNVLRAYLNQTPYDCGVQRAQATTRIADVENAQRQAAANLAADQQAEANRKAAEQAAAQQRQALLNRSWTAIAVSDWADYWGTSYVDWGGVTGQTSPQSANAAAIKACDAKGEGKNCQIAVPPFSQGCAAFAYKGSDLDEGGWGVGFGATEASARQTALSDCSVKRCEIKLSLCATPG